MNLEDAKKVHRALMSAVAYAGENPDDRKQGFPFCNPPLTDQLSEALDVMGPILQDLEYDGDMYGSYDDGAMYSNEFTDHNPT